MLNDLLYDAELPSAQEAIAAPNECVLRHGEDFAIKVWVIYASPVIRHIP